MSLDIAKESSMRRWDPGMELPRGGQSRIRMRPEELMKCPRDGEGTPENPLVIWAAHLSEGQRQELAIPEFDHEADLYLAIDANTDIAKTVAIRCGCTVVWIICPVHGRQYIYDENGDRIPIKWNKAGNPVEYLVGDADPHMTVRLGNSEDQCLLHGHINIQVDERGFPTQFMSSFQRRQSGHLKDGDDRVLELFEWADKGVSTEHRLKREAAYYDLFKTLTVDCDEEWELEDQGSKDPDYKPPKHLGALFRDDTLYTPDYSEEISELSPEMEEYIVRRWNPYERGTHSISIRNFGYRARRSNRHPYTLRYPRRCHDNKWSRQRPQTITSHV